jgi:predicted SprT family Zn-dependent metalloprotease
MAQTMEYSDDKLPELADVLKISKTNSSGETGSTARNSLPTKIDDSESESDDEPKNNDVIRKGGSEDAREIRKKKLEALSASVKKTRRILEPRSDNPLLRPIGRERDMPTKLPETTPKSRPKRHTRIIEEKEVDAFSDTDEDEGRDDAEEDSDDESDGMSDFIVDDDESLEEDDSEIEMTPPPPRSARRLTQGRRRGKGDDEEREDLEVKMRTLDLTDQDTTNDLHGSSKNEARPSKENNCEVTQQKKIHGDFTKAERKAEDLKETTFTIGSDVESKKKYTGNEEDARFTTPPPSPKTKPRTLTSPKKIQHIPMTPHRPSMDGFWSQEVVNDWNDEYSPRKAPKSQPKPLVSQDRSSSDLLSSPAKDKATQARIDRQAKKAFEARKDKTVQDFLLELDEKLTGGRVAKMVESTGGVKVVWSNRLTSSAGLTQFKQEKTKDTVRLPDGSMAPVYKYHAKIELSEKVVINEDQLLNTLAHEFCHVCTMMIDKVTNNPHGAVFKKWGAECTKRFKDRGVKVTSCHSYDIQYKYIWECTICGVIYQRHSKSISVERQRCGSCKGTLVQTRPAPRSAAARKLTSYQTFVKENMKKIKLENPGSPQKDVMRLLAKKYQEMKVPERGSEELDTSTDLEAVIIDDEDVLKESSPDVPIPGSVRKKLDFINLSDA